MMRVLPLCVLLSIAGVTSAQDNKAVAAQLFDAAGELMAAGKHADACPKYAESQRLDPQLGTLLHLAECLDAQGKTASAWANFKDAADLAAARGDLREPKIRARVAAIEPKVPRLTIRVSASAPGELEIKRNGGVVGKPAWGLPLPVDPGEQAIVASAPGRVSWSQSVQLAPGGRASVEVPELSAAISGAPAPEPAAAVSPLPPPAEPAVSEPAPEAQALGMQPVAAPGDNVDSGGRGRAQRVAGWAVLALGAIGLGVGVVFDIQSFVKLGDRSDVCPSKMNCASGSQDKIDDLTNDARSARRIGTIGLIAGGLLAAGGLTLLLTAPNDTRSEQVWLAPVLGPDQQGMRLMGRL